MCRFSCPVGLFSAKESLTPGNMVSFGKLALEGKIPWQEARSVVTSCTGCLLCLEYCEHDQKVPLILQKVRERFASSSLPSFRPPSQKVIYSCQGYSWPSTQFGRTIQKGVCLIHLWAEGKLSQEDLALLLSQDILFTSSECAFWADQLGVLPSPFYAHRLNLYDKFLKKLDSLPRPLFFYLTPWEARLGRPSFPQEVEILGEHWPLPGSFASTTTDWEPRLLEEIQSEIQQKSFQCGVVSCERAYLWLKRILKTRLYFLPSLFT